MQRGVVGVLTPQANPTVEPELSQLLSGQALMLTTRMCSDGADMLDRLRAYGDEIDRWIASFGGMAIDVFAFACTGTFYLQGVERERAYLQALEARGLRVHSATGAIRAALSALGAQRVALVNPYPPQLRDAALAYWRAAGLEIVEVIEVEQASSGHPIYGIDAQATETAVKRALSIPAEIVLCTGTGMATLPTLRRLRSARPVLTSNLCLAWSSLNALGADLDLRNWLATVTNG